MKQVYNYLVDIMLVMVRSDFNDHCMVNDILVIFLKTKIIIQTQTQQSSKYFTLFLSCSRLVSFIENILVSKLHNKYNDHLKPNWFDIKRYIHAINVWALERHVLNPIRPVRYKFDPSIMTGRLSAVLCIIYS